MYNEGEKMKPYLYLIFFQVHAEEISGNNGYVELFFCAKKLDDKVRWADVFHWNTDIRYDSCVVQP